MEHTKVELSGVPETLLWNLYQRATEARRPDRVLDDPWAVELVDRIDYPFAETFGSGGLGQWQALRASRFDLEVRRFLADTPGGTVVALGEGLETQFFRVDDGRVRWLTVELPETVAVRDQLLPPEPPRRRTLACSVLDESWMDAVQPGPVLLSAQGLLMYVQPGEVHRLLEACADRFPGATMVLDGVPRWFSDRTLAGTMRTAEGYVTPPMPWALDRDERAWLAALPAVASVTELVPPRGRGIVYGGAFPVLNRIPALRRLGVTGLPILRVGFADRH